MGFQPFVGNRVSEAAGNGVESTSESTLAAVHALINAAADAPAPGGAASAPVRDDRSTLEFLRGALAGVPHTGSPASPAPLVRAPALIAGAARGRMVDFAARSRRRPAKPALTSQRHSVSLGRFSSPPTP